MVRVLTGESTDRVVLVHGVFGAGKSYLISVIILLLRRFKDENLFLDESMRVGVSSMTNGNEL